MRKLLLVLLTLLPVLGQEFQGRVVRNMAELRALRPLDSKPLVRVLGYYTPGDGGGGDYTVTNTIAGTNANGGRIVALGGTKSFQLSHSGQINSRQFGIVPSTNHTGVALCEFVQWCASRGIRSVIANGDYYFLNTNGVVLISNTHIEAETPGGAVMVRNYSDPALQNPRFSPFRVTNSAIPFGGRVPIWATNITVSGIGFRTENPDGTNVGNNAAFIGVSGLRLDQIYSGKAKDGWGLILASDNVIVTRPTIRNDGALFRDGIHIIGGTNGMILGADIYSGDDAIAFGGNGAVIDRWVVSGGTLHSDYAHAIRFTQETEANTNAYSNIIVSDVVYRAAEIRNGAVLFQNLATNLPVAFRNISIKGMRGDIAYKTEVTGVDRGFSIVDADQVLLEDCHIDMAVRNPFYVERCGLVSIVNCTANGTWGTNLLQTLYAINVDRLNVRGGRFRTNPTNAAVTARFENVNAVSLQGVEFENLTGQQIIQTAAGVGSFQSVGSHYLSTGTAFAFSVNPTNVILSANVVSSGLPAATWQGGAPPATAQIGNNIGLQSIGTTVASTFAVVTPSGGYVSSIDSPGNVQMRLVNTNSQFTFGMDTGSSGNNILLRIGAQSKSSATPLLMLAPNDSGSTPWLGVGTGSGIYHGPRFIDFGAAPTDYTAGTARVRVNADGMRIEPSGVTSNPHASALLDLVSTTKGMLIRPITKVQRNAIPSPSDGLFVFQGDAGNYGPRWYSTSLPGWIRADGTADP